MTRVYAKFEEKEVHEYDIVEIADTTILKYSSNNSWYEHVKDTEAASLVDDGNGVKINLGNRKIKLDYTEAFEVLILLAKNNDCSFKICKEETIIKL